MLTLTRVSFLHHFQKLSITSQLVTITTWCSPVLGRSSNTPMQLVQSQPVQNQQSLFKALISSPSWPAANRASQPPNSGYNLPHQRSPTDWLGGEVSSLSLRCWSEIFGNSCNRSSKRVPAKLLSLTKIYLCRRKEIVNIIQPNCSQSRKGHLTNSPFLRMRAGLLFKIFFTQVASLHVSF